MHEQTRSVCNEAAAWLGEGDGQNQPLCLDLGKPATVCALNIQLVLNETKL